MDISLYFHIPFCEKKCPYCHFFSFTFKKSHIKDFLTSLFNELEQKEKLIKGKNIVSIYFGGGTPSLLNEKDLLSILNWISKKLKIAPTCEITIETNPKISKEKISSLKKFGFNRISLGAQSLQDKDLQILQRNHTRKDILQTLQNLEKHFDNISIDLLYDIPHQTIKSFSKTLLEIEKLPLSHISLYNLTFELKTKFYAKKEKLLPFVPSAQSSLKMLNLATKNLKKMGFERYEISAFAKEKKISYHNIGYWTGRSFLGFGPSAFSYFEKKRFQNISHFQKYIQCLKNNRSAISFEEKLKFPNNLNELLALHLRMIKGVNLNWLEKKYQKFSEKTKRNLLLLEKENLIAKKGFRIYLTKKGLLFYDEIASFII